MPADSFVRIWKFITRPSLFGSTRLHEAAATLAVMRDSAVQNKV